MSKGLKHKDPNPNWPAKASKRPRGTPHPTCKAGPARLQEAPRQLPEPPGKTSLFISCAACVCQDFPLPCSLACGHSTSVQLFSCVACLHLGGGKKHRLSPVALTLLAGLPKNDCFHRAANPWRLDKPTANPPCKCRVGSFHTWFPRWISSSTMYADHDRTSNCTSFVGLGLRSQGLVQVQAPT